MNQSVLADIKLSLGLLKVVVKIYEGLALFSDEGLSSISKHCIVFI